MNRVLTNIEFFTFEDEVWIRSNGCVRMLRETDYNIIDSLLEYVSTSFEKACLALREEYMAYAMNVSHYKYKMACRFIRCNFSALDSFPDIDSNLHFRFEHINCPLRGECKWDRIICRPTFSNNLSPAEKKVMALVYDGLSEDSIANRLYLSPFTVHTHIRNVYAKLGIHSRSEFVKFATQKNLFS